MPGNGELLIPKIIKSIEYWEAFNFLPELTDLQKSRFRFNGVLRDIDQMGTGWTECTKKRVVQMLRASRISPESASDA